MFKVIGAICGIFLVSVSLAYSGASESQKSKGDSPKAAWIVDDFEDGDLDGWAAPTGSCLMSNDTIGADGSSRSLKIDGGCGHFGGTYFDMGGMAITDLSYWVRSGSTSASDGYLLLDDDDPDNLFYILLLALGNGGDFIANNGSIEYGLGPYAANTWYPVSINIDWVGHTYNIGINGQTVGWNLSFQDLSQTSVDHLHLYNNSISLAWWDQIYVSTPPISPEIMTDGFESADDTGWTFSGPAIPRRLVLYSAGGVTGAIGGRLGADNLCGQAAEGMAGLPLHARTMAFISVDAADEIRDAPNWGVPTDRIITGPGTGKIADNWADLLDGNIDLALNQAGVFNGNNFWYSGSNTDGSITATTCTGWTDGSAFLGGSYGVANETSGGWISTSEATCGSAAYSILCLAWRQ